MFWTPEVDIGVVTLSPHPSAQRPPAGPALRLTPVCERRSPEGRRLLIRRGAAWASVLVLDDPPTDAPLSLIIPFDETAPRRLAAASRLLGLSRGSSAPASRVAPERRRRLRQMLRAIDGRACGASHREIAAVLFGARRVAAEIWPDSALRYAIQRLVRDGAIMVGGGYRDLLGHSGRS